MAACRLRRVTAVVALVVAVTAPHVGAVRAEAGAEEGGSVLWLSRYHGSAVSGHDANAIAVSPDGTHVFVTGATGSRGIDWATLAYDASSGSPLWKRRYDRQGREDESFALTTSPDGTRVYVTGYSTSDA